MSELFPQADYYRNILNKNISDSQNLFEYHLKIINKSILNAIENLNFSIKHRFFITDRKICDEINDFLISKGYKVTFKEISVQQFPKNENGVSLAVLCYQNLLELEISW